MKSLIGTQFHSHYADSNPLWKVTKKAGANAWSAVVVDSPDWEGTRKLFSTDEITRAASLDRTVSRLAEQHTDWWASQPVGSIVHYANIQGRSWVRGKIVEHGGEHMMLPLALVGDWYKGDLPHRLVDGSIYLPYHADHIRNQKTMKPNASNMYEEDLRGPDPRGLPEIDLTVPPLSPEAARTAKLFRVRDRMTRELTAARPEDIERRFEAVEAELEDLHDLQLLPLR